MRLKLKIIISIVFYISFSFFIVFSEFLNEESEKLYNEANQIKEEYYNNPTKENMDRYNEAMDKAIDYEDTLRKIDRWVSIEQIEADKRSTEEWLDVWFKEQEEIRKQEQQRQQEIEQERQQEMEAREAAARDVERRAEELWVSEKVIERMDDWATLEDAIRIENDIEESIRKAQEKREKYKAEQKALEEMEEAEKDKLFDKEVQESEAQTMQENAEYQEWRQEETQKELQQENSMQEDDFNRELKESESQTMQKNAEYQEWKKEEIQKEIKSTEGQITIAQEGIESAEIALEAKKQTEKLQNLYEAQKAYEPETPGYKAVQTQIDTELKSETQTLLQAQNNLTTAEAERDQALLKWNEKQALQWARNIHAAAQEKVKDLKTKYANARKAAEACQPGWWVSCEQLLINADLLEEEISAAEMEAEIAAEAKQEAQEKYDKSPFSHGDITSKWFQIKVGNLTPGMSKESAGVETTSELINFALGTLIQKLMIALWSLAILVMTIWGGYIVLHHGQDELLSKWKAIFMSWVYALVVALASYYIIAIVRFILYN